MAKRRILSAAINQIILWPFMEFLILPVLTVVVMLTWWFMNQGAEAGWVVLLISVPFGIVDSGELAICFLGRVWQYAFGTIGETWYFLFLAILMTYLYFQCAELLLMILFRRDFGMVIMKRKIITLDGEEVTRAQAVRRGFYKWNKLLLAPIWVILSCIKHENLFYNSLMGQMYWDEKMGTQVVEI